MKQMAAGEPQVREFDAAASLARLALGHSLNVMQLLATLGRELFDLNARHLRALAAADEHEALQLRVEHLRQTTAWLIDGARQLAELGSETRVRFSRLLTEQLASGRHDLMDSFQSFFAFLPAHNHDLPEMLALVRERAERAFGDIGVAVAQAEAMSPAAPIRVPASPRHGAVLRPPQPAPMADAQAA